jgi:hypothetical protein
MQLQTNAGLGMPAGDEPGQQGLLQAMLRALLAEVLATQQPAVNDTHPDLPPLLKPEQVKELTGWSRNTVDRMIDDGDLPHIIAREGSKQRMRQVPKAFVLQMLADLNRGVSIPDMRAYARRWQASVVPQGQVAAGLAGAAL